MAVYKKAIRQRQTGTSKGSCIAANGACSGHWQVDPGRNNAFKLCIYAVYDARANILWQPPFDHHAFEIYNARGRNNPFNQCGYGRSDPCVEQRRINIPILGTFPNCFCGAARFNYGLLQAHKRGKIHQ